MAGRTSLLILTPIILACYQLNSSPKTSSSKRLKDQPLPRVSSIRFCPIEGSWDKGWSGYLTGESSTQGGDQ